MANPIGYNGADVHVTHPGFWMDDGYVGVGADGYTIVSYSTGLNPNGTAVTSLAPNTILKSIVHSGTGVWTFTFKETWPAMLIPKFTTVCPSGSYRGMQVVSCTVGQSTAASPVTPVCVVQVNTSGTPSELPANGGFFWEFVMQQSSAYL